jgi:two-component system, NtrC family, nitrogen regulation sensor histidine kinase NtrY
MNSARTKRSPRRLSYDQRIFWQALLGGLPGMLLGLVLLWRGDYTRKVQWTFTLIVVLTWLAVVFSLRTRVIMALQTLSNLLSGLREGDFSIRARGAKRDDAMGEVMTEVNLLVDTLKEQRLGALEATQLLRKVMAEIDVSVFTFDGEQRLRLVNRAGERLLAQPAERLLGRSAVELNLADCLEGENSRAMQIAFPGASGRWGVRRTFFREQGLSHQLLVLSNLSRELREEERQAWQRLVRVLGHELNNSLAPIMSIAGSLASLLNREPRAADWKEDMRDGLTVIGNRAEALNRFMGAYARLAKLPPPRPQAVDIGQLVRRIVGLETRRLVHVASSPEMLIEADADQLEQLLINLLRNAVDAALETGGGVQIDWISKGGVLFIKIEDEGPGLANTANLFVPFFTTKPNGTGVGLVLSRQIAEAHGGALTLENRTTGRGCVARLQLPARRREP